MHTTDISYASLSCHDSKNIWSVDSRPILSSIPPVRHSFSTDDTVHAISAARKQYLILYMILLIGQVGW